MSKEIKEKIGILKREKNAVILAHYYAPHEVQEIADYVGDSFYLAKVAKSSAAEIIVFAGVSFMGESAKILNPEKKVLMPDPAADCAMAHMASANEIERLREAYDDLAVVCYINSTAELKCMSDVCVTSSNAVKIVRALPNKNIYFIPDKNLGAFVKEAVPEKNVILGSGCCPIHARISPESLRELTELYPKAPVLTHPECEREVREMSDYIGSTAELIEYARESGAGDIIVCTEDGVGFKLLSDSPDKKFHFPTPTPVCLDMKLNTLEGVLRVLTTEEGEVTVEEKTRVRALMPLERMLELAK